MMRKVLPFIIILLLPTLSLPAASFRDRDSWIPSNVSIGTGNDKWAFGLSRNNDDQLSYSVDAMVDAPIWRFSFHMAGITNRGWKDAWYTKGEDSSASSFHNGRYDVLSLAWGLKLEVAKTKDFSLMLLPDVGLDVAGNLGFVYAQNLLHKIGKIHQVNIPYEEGIIYAPRLDLTARFDFHGKMTFTESDLHLAFVARTENSIRFQYSQYLGVEASLQNSKTIRPLSVSIGYQWYQNQSGWRTQDLTNWMMKGLRFGFNIDTGVFHVTYLSCLDSTFGYTVYYFDVMDMFRKSTWKENDLYVNTGRSWYLNGSYHWIEIEIPFTGSRFSLIANNRYVAGDPTFKDVELESDPSVVPRVKKGFSSWMIGAKYAVPDGWSKGWVTPFVDVSLGFEHWETAELDNMLPASSKPWQVWSEYTFLMDAEIGLSLVPVGAWKSRNASYRLVVAGALTWVPQAEKIVYLLKKSATGSPSGNEKTPYLIPRMTVGFQIGFDL